MDTKSEIFQHSVRLRTHPDKYVDLLKRWTYTIDKELDDPYKQMLLEAYRAKWNELLPMMLSRKDNAQTDTSFLSQLRVAVGDSVREKIMSGKDPLTDLPNKDSILRATQRMLNIAQREDMNANILYLDFDNFKTKVNDVFGHEAGDDVIRAMGSIFNTVKRASDIEGRFSGDEFGIALLDIDNIQLILDRIEIGMQKLHNIPGMEHIGLSIGLSEYNPADGFVSAKELYERAEIAMSHSKGRNDARIKITRWEKGMDMLPRNTSR